MDRSFLFQTPVIEAAKRFVCIRLATYEDADEAALVKSLGGTQSGEVENSIFAILSPDGKTQLVRAGRAPKFRDADALAKAMHKIASDYPEQTSLTHPALPTAASVRLAINLAACERLPLVVVHSTNPERLAALEAKVAKLAWSDEFRGRFLYAKTAVASDLANVSGSDEGVLIVRPESFGRKASVLAKASADATSATLGQLLRDSASPIADGLTYRDIVRDGRRTGVFWQTVVPVTDPLERKVRGNK